MPVFHQDFAAKQTRLTLEQTRDLESGESVRIYGYSANNHTGAPVSIEVVRFTKPAGTPNFYIMNLAVPANSNVSDHTQWLADYGVKVNGVSAGVEITFFHSHGGA